MDSETLCEQPKESHRIGITVGAFDLCHAGHMLMFKDCKDVCDYLIVGLQIDPSITDASYRGKKKNKPIMSVMERMEILKGIKYIDTIFQYSSEEDLDEMLRTIDWDIRIIGSDWKGKKYTGFDIRKPVHFHIRNHNYSTTELRKRIYEAEKNAITT